MTSGVTACLFACGFLLTALARQAATMTMVEDGKPLLPVVFRAHAAREEQDAAAELCRVIERMSGARLIVGADLPGAPPFCSARRPANWD